MALLAPVSEAQTVTPTPTNHDWCYYFDFASSTHGWVGASSPAAYGTWGSGSGFSYTDGVDTATARRAVWQERTFTTTLVNRFTLIFDLSKGTYAQPSSFAVLIRNQAGANIASVRNDNISSGTLISYIHQQAATNIAGVRVLVQSSVDQSAPLDSFSGSVLLRAVELRGLGTNPFGSSNCGSFVTPTPTPTATTTVQPTPTLPDDFNINLLCPSSPVFAGEVSIEYAVACSHCLVVSDSGSSPFGTPVAFGPTPDPLTPTATSSVATATLIANAATYQPPPTESAGATSTPAPVTLTCNFVGGGGCEFMSLNYGSQGGSGITHEDICLPDFCYRAVGMTFLIPLVEGSNLPVNVTGLTVNYSITSGSYSGDNIFYNVLSTGGNTLDSAWLQGASSGNTAFSPLSAVTENNAAQVQLLLFSSRYGTQPELEGSLTVTSVSLTYLEDSASGSSAFDDLLGSVTCYLPQDYPVSGGGIAPDSLFNFSIGDLESTPECFVVIPEIDISGVINAITGLVGGDPIGATGIPEVQVCVFWYDMLEITIFGIEVPVFLVINAFLLFALVRMILRF